MEVDERLRWLEGKTNSSLHPKGEDLRGLLADEKNRSGFLEFCNNSESRHIFIHMSSNGCGPIKISKQPPSSLSSKSLFLLKCNSSSRITKDSISHDVVYSECSDLPLEHLEVLVREVYLPMMSSTGGGAGHSVSSERIMDLLHRLMGSVQVTEGHECGELVLMIPSLDVLTEWMMMGGSHGVGGSTSGSSVNTDSRRSVVIHVMETYVVSWMKQVKIALHFDPNNSILKADGKIAGPLSELKYWEHRLYQLMSVRDQLGSPDVYQILHRLEQVHSSYTDTFMNVHRDIAKGISDTELALVYLNTLKPIFLQVNAAFSPDTLIKLFPSLITTLALVWQYSGFYCITTHFHRLLRLISNELSVKARSIIGDSILEDPSTACINIRLALRMCSAFRGHYLDRKDICENIWLNCREDKQQQQQLHQPAHSSLNDMHERSQQNVSTTTVTTSITAYTSSHASSLPLCPWPARNAAPFHRLNMTMERCNDLLELVQTIEHFSELSAVASLCSSDGLDPILTDIYNDFNATLAKFKSSTKDLLSIDSNSFEESFFAFRSSVKALECRLSSTMLLYFEECYTLESSLRLLESFQGLISRDSVKEVLQPKLDSIIDILHSDILSFRSKVPFIVTHPPVISNTPPTSTRLIWLKAIEHRITEPLERIRGAAPYLLEGEKGFTLRRLHSEVVKEIESNWKNTVNKWTKTAPVDIDTKLQLNVLEIRKDEDSGGTTLMVNYDNVLEEVLRETHYLSGPVLSLNTVIPPSLRALSTQLSSQSLHLHKSSLEVCVRIYNEMIATLSDTHKSLFQHKLQQLDILIQEGIHDINWTSPQLPDYLAKLKGMLTLTLVPSVEEVLRHSQSIEDTVKSWSQIPSLDIFQDSNVDEITDIVDNHKLLVRRLQSHLELSIKSISSRVEEVFKVVDVSGESSAWMDFLSSLDSMILSGIKDTLIQTLSSLSTRAQRYEQGGTIPPLVGVSLALHGKKVIFEPPLSSALAVKSVLEIIRKIFSETFLMTSNLQRLIPNKEDYYSTIVDDSSVQSVTQKITAHVETSSRQCQSLCKRFSQYSFLWEQDVIATFNKFIMGLAEPHPRKFTRPETVNRTRSASQSARSRSQSAKLHSSSGIQSNSIVMEVVTGYSDWEFLKPDTDDLITTPNDGGTPFTDDGGGGHTPCSTSHPPSSSGRSSQHGSKHKKTTSLEDFEGELSVFQGILERLNKSPDSVEVGWIKVDQLPVKDILITLANKWIFVYTNYLEKKVLSVLTELEEFFTEIEPEVESINSDEVDPSHIMKLVTILNKVNLKQVTMDGKFGAVHRAVTLLEKFKHPLSVSAQNQFESVPNRWSSLKKRLSLSKQRLTPHVQSHSAVITKDLREFDNHIQSLHNSFLASECLNSDCDINTAFVLLHDYIGQLSVYQAQYEDLMELQELLQSAVVNFSLLKLFEEELKTAGMIWQETEKFILLQEEWKSTVWTSVNTEDIKMSCDSQLTSINSMGDFTDSWNIRTTLVKDIEEILQTIPLIDGLCSPFMRPRHWKQVLKYSPNLILFNILIKNGAVDINALSELTFGRMMELKLIVHSAEVLSIVDKASKDIAVEELLKNLEEVWLSMTFQFKSHTRLHGGDQAINDISSGISSSASSSNDSRPSSSVKRKSISSGRVSVLSTTPTTKDQPVLLLENINDIINSLNHYQSSLQNLHGSITASSFKDELYQWHKQLQTVEAVLVVWMRVQSLWVQLEEVLSSKEVEQHLPTQHFMFTTTMDKEWRVLMKETAKTPNVLKVCLQEDLLSLLEKFLETLSMCRSALLNYMEGRRARCPWFYFLQLEDILNLVCYGSRVQILSECIPKLIPYSSGLILIDSLPGSVPTPPVSSHYHHHHHHHVSSSPYITGVVCSDGHTLHLAELIRCDGPVESIINHLMYSIEKTLTKQMETCYTEYLPSDRDGIGLSLDSLHSLWTSANSHQVIVLTTQLVIHRFITSAIQSKKSIDEQLKSLETVMTILKQLLSHVDKLIGRRSSTAFNDTPLSILSILPNTRQDNPDSLPDSFGAVKASESRLTTGSGSMVTDTPTHIAPKGDEGSPVDMSSPQHSSKSTHQHLFTQLVTVVLSYINKTRQLMNQPDDMMTLANCLMHYSSHDGSGYSLNGSGTSGGVQYGLRHIGSVPVASSPHLEDVARHVLLTINNNCSGLLCSDQFNVMYTVREIGEVFGYRVFPVICSPDTRLNDLMNIIKGIASTGCWLYLHNIHLLPVHMINAIVNCLNVIKCAKQTGQATIEIGGETLTETELKSAFCMASTDSVNLPRLPPSVHTVFQTYMCDEGKPLVNDITIESLLISSGFKNVPFIKNCLSSLHQTTSIDYEVLKTVIIRSLDHTHYSSTSNDANTSFTSSIGHQVMSALSQSKHTFTPSRKHSAHRLSKAALQNITEENEQSDTVGTPDHHEVLPLSSSVEVTAIILAIWELLVPQYSDTNTLILSLEKAFTGVDVSGILSKTDGVCSDMTEHCSWSRESIENVQESRAASVMCGNEHSDGKLSSCIEETILQCCLLGGLDPCGSFLHTAHSLILQLTHNRVVTINGPVDYSGKEGVVNTCIETLKMIGHSVTVTRIPIDTIGERNLLGNDKLKGDGMLSYLHSSQSSSTTSSVLPSSSSILHPLHLVLLEGNPSPLLMDTLKWLTVSNCLLTILNMKSIILDSSVKFIIMSPSTDPSSLVSIPHSVPVSITVSSECITWRSIVQQSLISLDKSIHYSLLDLCDTYLPGILKAVLNNSEDGSPQFNQVMPNQLQLVKSMCRILECVFSSIVGGGVVYSDEAIKRGFIYALIWSFGVALDTTNKELFQHHMKTTFTQALTSMEEGSSTLWEYRLEGEDCLFKQCHCGITVQGDRSFVHTNKTAAINELLKLLYNNHVSVMVDGPVGSGKTSFVCNSVYNEEESDDSGSMVSLLHLLMNTEYTTGNMWTQLKERLMWHSGTNYVPMGTETLVVMVDDLHLTQINSGPLSHGSISGLIHHHISSGSVCVPDREHSVSNTVYVCTTASTDSSQHEQLFNDVLYIHWDQYSPDELMHIYMKVLSSHFLSPDTPTPIDSVLLSLLVHCSVQIHSKTNEAFMPREDRRHYMYTLSTLDSVMRTLIFQWSGDSISSCTPIQLLTSWILEMYWVYCGRMTSTVDREVFSECVTTAIKKYFCDHPLLSQLLSLVSHKLSLTPAQSLHTLLTHTHQHLDLTTPTPPPYLHKSLIEISSQIIHHLHLPHTLSSLIVLGVTEMEYLVHLISSAKGYTLVRPSQLCCGRLTIEDNNEGGSPFTAGDVYDLSEFKKALKTLYSMAALKNEQVLVYLDDHELVSPAHLSPVYQFITECSISVDYTSEEKDKLTNALRPDVCAEGEEFNTTKAWMFFINRVKKNVRFLVSLADLTIADEKGLIHSKDLINSTKIIYQLPWDRKYLLQIAKNQLKSSLHLPHHLIDNTTHLLSSLHINIHVCEVMCRLNLRSPTNEHYQYFIQRFCHELSIWMKKLSENESQLNTTINCINTTKDIVNQLQNKLKRETVVMEEKIKSYSQLTVQMGQDMAIAEEQNKLVAKQTERIRHLQQVLPEYEHVHQQYMEELVSIEDGTKDIALQLDQQSLLDLRSQTKPPGVVQDLLEAVIIIVKSPTADLSWNKGAKRLMANIDRFREMLMEFSNNQEVSEVLLSALNSYTNKNRFNEDDMMQDSGGCIAAGQLCAWVLGVQSYHKMLCDSIRPIDNRKTHVKASLHEYTEKLTQLQQKVKVLDDRLEGLGSAIEQASIDKSQQANIVFDMKKELKQAEKLVELLSSVSEGWTNQKDQLATALSRHIGPLSVGVAFVTYLAKHPPHIVREVVDNVLKPTVIDIGFTVNDDHVFTGLLDQLCPKLLPLTPPTLTQTQPSDTPTDSFPNQPIKMETSQTKGLVTGTQYMNLCTDMVACLSSSSGDEERLDVVSSANRVWMDIVLSSWNKWPLISDPENCLQFGEDWNIVYAKEMTYEVIRSLEQSMIEGHKVVLTNLQIPLHPVLLPVIEVGLKWNNFDTRPPFIEFCGRRLHINCQFQLVLTTPTAHEHVPPNSGTLLINMAPNVSIIQSKLFQDAAMNSTTAMFNFTEYSTIMEGIFRDRRTVRNLNDTLLGQLKKMEDGESMMVTVDGVDHVMANITEVISSLQSQSTSLEPHYSSLSFLMSACTYGSLVYMLLYQLRRRSSWFSVSLEEYQQWFRQVLSDEEVVRCCEEDRSRFESMFRSKLIGMVHDKLQLVLPYPDMTKLLKGLMLVNKIDNDSSISLINQINQILYIIGNEDHILSILNNQMNDITLPHKPNTVIPDELFTKLFTLSIIGPATLEVVYKSMQDRTTEWEELLTLDHSSSPPELSLPWKLTENNERDTVQYTLEDLVILRTISSQLVTVQSLTSDEETQPSPQPVLQEVLQVDSCNGNLLVLLYSNEDFMSQVNMATLEETLNKCADAGSKSIIAFDGCSQSVDDLFSKMSLSKEDIVLVKNSHTLFTGDGHSGNVSRRFVDFVGGDFHRKERLLMLLIDLDVDILVEGTAHDILSVSKCINLSSVLPMKLSKATTIFDKMHTATNSHLKYLSFLAMILLIAPQMLHNNTTTHPQPLPKLIFLLGALHCHIATLKDPDQSPAQLHTFTNCLNLLKVFESGINTQQLLSTLNTFIKHQYTISDDHDSVIDSYIQLDLLNDDSAILMAVDGLPIPLPSSSVPIERFSDHVIDIIDSIQSPPMSHP